MWRCNAANLKSQTDPGFGGASVAVCTVWCCVKERLSEDDGYRKVKMLVKKRMKKSIRLRPAVAQNESSRTEDVEASRRTLTRFERKGRLGSGRDTAQTHAHWSVFQAGAE